MGELLNLVFDIAVEIFVISTMLSLGLQLELRQILKPIKNVSIVTKALLSNFILIPVISFAIAKLLGLDDSLTLGLLLIGLCAGAPMLAKYAEFANADMAYAAALMVLLQIGTIVAVPLFLPLYPVELGSGGLELDVFAILKTLIVSMLLPIAAGMILHFRYKLFSKSIQPVFSNLATISIAVLISAGLFLTHQDLICLWGSGAFPSAVLLISSSLAVGYFMGGREQKKKFSFMFACGSRNDTAAILIASQNMDDERVLLMVLAFASVMIIMNSLFSSELGRRNAPSL